MDNDNQHTHPTQSGGKNWFSGTKGSNVFNIIFTKILQYLPGLALLSHRNGARLSRRVFGVVGTMLAFLLMVPAQAQNLLTNGGFETPTLASGGYQYNPTGAGWTFNARSGVQANGSDWKAATAPQGNQTAFLQGIYGAGNITQSVNLPSAGKYTISFLAAQRACCVTPYAQSINVTVDGAIIGQATPPSTTSYTSYSYTFQATAGNHTIGLAVPLTSDNTVFIDDVSLTAVPPVVSITAPTNNSRFGSNTSIALIAEASSSSDTITKVEFFSDDVLLGTVLQPPYSFNWDNVAPGSFTVTAKATNAQGISTTSQPITVLVEAAPTINLSGPPSTSALVAPANISLKASASASGTNNAIAQVAFYNGTAFLGSITTAPYEFVWHGVAAGIYRVTAVATDSLGGTTTSNPVDITVYDHAPPAVSLSADPADATAPATINLMATAESSSRTVERVEYYSGNQLLGTVAQAPYVFSWSNVAAGNYTVTAKAIDTGGVATTSLPVTVTVTAPGGPPARMFFIENDHLDTPRLITDTNNNVVWQWDNSDPFGANLPNSDPGNTGQAFTFNARFPGQYFDRETGLHYNYFRDYDPATGRYLQSDPIGLDGGIHTYAYVSGNPIGLTDPMGLLAIPVPVTPVLVPGATTTGGSRGDIDPKTDMPTTIPPSSPSAIPIPISVCWAAAPVCAAIIAATNDEPLYPDNPDKAPDRFSPIRGTPGRQCDDGSVWERDTSSHGGDQWKRWPDRKSWEKGRKPNSIWPDGRVRK